MGKLSKNACDLGRAWLYWKLREWQRDETFGPEQRLACRQVADSMLPQKPKRAKKGRPKP